MKRFALKSSRMLLVLIAMSALLPLLAAWQYYWLGQVSEGASQRLESGLRSSATQFRHDFNREFIRAYLNFLIDAGSPPQNIEQYHAERLQHWNQSAPYPRLISEVFIVNFEQHGQLRLRQLNANSGRFEQSEWPAELAGLHNRFGGQGGNDSSQPSKPALNSLAEEIPALIIPFPLEASQKSTEPGNPLLLPGFTVVKLDLGYMQREFIPALVQRHFGADSQNAYNLGIVSASDPKRAIFSTSPSVDFSTSDVSTRIFGLESDEIRTFLHTEGASAPSSAQPGLRQLRLINFRPATAGTSTGEDGRWQLLIKHQAGSLTAAVGSVRRRNLAISFSILMLLAAGIFMTALSTWRAQRLARQQINFVAGVTHELRTPLAVICSAGENLADGIVDSPAKAVHYGRVINTEGRRLAEMVEQVLEFAGAQSGRQNYVMKPTEVADFIDDAVTACRTQIQEKNFKIETAVAPDLPSISGDQAALKRAVQNLLSNAIKYDSENRWAKISALKFAENEVRIVVEDRGPGISSSEIRHIFEPFYRGHDAVDAQIEGSGIGLSLVKQIAEAHGGKVSVKSTSGAGSVFTLHLPVAS